MLCPTPAFVNVVPPPCFTGYYTLMELLEEVPPECRRTATCTATSDSHSSHTPNVGLPDGFKVQPWEGLEEQVMCDINEELHTLKSRHVLRSHSE